VSRGDLGRKSVSLLGSTWVAGLVNLAATVLVARTLGPGAVGALAFSLGLSGLAMAALLPGFTQAHMKRVAEGRDVGLCLATFGAIKLALYAGLGLALAAAWPWRGVLFETPALETVFVLLLVGRLASSLSEVFSIALLAREHAVEQGTVVLLSRGLRFVATVAVLAWAPDVRGVAAAHALEGLTELALAGGLVVQRLRPALRRPTRESVLGYWRYARPLLVNVPLGLVQDSLDRVVVKQWAGLEAAGFYHVARGLWETLASVSAYPSMILFTRMSRLFAAGSAAAAAEARSVFFSGVEKLLFVTAPLGLGLWFLAEPLITLLFAADFAPAAATTRIFVLAVLAANTFNPYTQVLYALEAHGRLVPVVLLRFAVYLAALAVLVPDSPGAGIPGLMLGERGAALARLLLLVFPAWVYVGWARELAGIGFYRHARAYLGGFAAGVSVFEAVTRSPLAVAGPVVVTLAASALGLAAYAVVVRTLNPVARETALYCARLLDPGRFLVFLRGEIDKSPRS
jgi:O-antigen/teichoic acid export membrane protein